MSHTRTVSARSGSDIVTDKSSQKRAGEKLVFAGKTDAITSGIITDKKSAFCSDAQRSTAKSKRTKGALSHKHGTHYRTSAKDKSVLYDKAISYQNSLKEKEGGSPSATVYVSEYKGASTIRGSPKTEGIYTEKDVSALVPAKARAHLPQPSIAVDALYHTKARVDKCLAYKSKATSDIVYSTRQRSSRELIKGVQTKTSYKSEGGRLQQKRFLLEDSFVAATAAKKGARFETLKRLQSQKISSWQSISHVAFAFMSESDELKDADKVHETVYRGRRVYKNYRSVRAHRKGKVTKVRKLRARISRARALRMRAMRGAASRRAVIRKVVKARIISRASPYITRALSSGLGLGRIFAGLFGSLGSAMPFLWPILFFIMISSALGATAAQNAATSSLPPYITSEMVEAALEAQERYGHPAGATIAQIILESGAGDHLSGLAEEDNNLFGMKSGGPDGGFYRGHPEVTGSRLWDTHEHYDGESVEVQDYFLSFTSAKDCILFRSRVFLQHPIYANNPLIKQAIEEHSSDKMAEGLKSAGYATSDSYVANFVAILDAYKLRRFDTTSLKDFQESKQAIIGALADGSLSEAQRKIISQAYVTASPGKGFCAKYISWVFRDAGYGYPTGNACDMYRSWCHSSDLSELRPGMICAVPSYGAESSPGHTYGHIGIYVGGGKIRDNIGSVRDSDLSEWLRYYGTTHTPKWGWVFGVDLSTQ